MNYSLYGIINGTIFLVPVPWGPGRANKVKYHLISFTKSISKIFKPNLTNDRYITYQTGFSFGPWVMPQGWDWGVPRGGGVCQKFIFSKIQPNLVCELLTLMAC